MSVIRGAGGGAAHCCYEHEGPTLSIPFGSCGRPPRCNRLRGKDIEDGRGRRCRTGGGADRGARSGPGRSGGVCTGAAYPPARQADAGIARLRHQHRAAVGDGGLVAPVACAAGGDGVHQQLLEGCVLPAGGRGISVLAGQCPRGEERAGPGQTDRADAVWLAKVAERACVGPRWCSRPRSVGCAI